MSIETFGRLHAEILRKVTDKTKKPSTEAAPGTMSESEQRFSSLFKVASKLSFKSPR
jgi:hypothetical protein